MHSDAEGLVVAVDASPDGGFASYPGAANPGEDRADDLVAEGEHGGDSADAAGLGVAVAGILGARVSPLRQALADFLQVRRALGFRLVRAQKLTYPVLISLLAVTGMGSARRSPWMTPTSTRPAGP